MTKAVRSALSKTGSPVWFSTSVTRTQSRGEKERTADGFLIHIDTETDTAMVAAAAVTGCITDVRTLLN